MSKTAIKSSHSSARRVSPHVSESRLNKGVAASALSQAKAAVRDRSTGELVSQAARVLVSPNRKRK